MQSLVGFPCRRASLQGQATSRTSRRPADGDPAPSAPDQGAEALVEVADGGGESPSILRRTSSSRSRMRRRCIPAARISASVAWRADSSRSPVQPVGIGEVKEVARPAPRIPAVARREGAMQSVHHGVELGGARPSRPVQVQQALTPAGQQRGATVPVQPGWALLGSRPLQVLLSPLEGAQGSRLTAARAWAHAATARAWEMTAGLPDCRAHSWAAAAASAVTARSHCSRQYSSDTRG
jgi:hypothetical protein